MKPTFLGRLRYQDGAGGPDQNGSMFKVWKLPIKSNGEARYALFGSETGGLAAILTHNRPSYQCSPLRDVMCGIDPGLVWSADNLQKQKMCMKINRMKLFPAFRGEIL